MNTLVYQQGQGTPCAAFLKDGVLHEFRRGDMGTAEGLYYGKVNRVMKELNAAFVRLNDKSEGFLPFEKGEPLPRPGDCLYVQIRKPAIGGKAPFLTRDICLTGRYLVYLPFGRGSAVSQRIQDKAERERALALVRKLPKAEGAFIARSLLLTAKEEALLDEAAALVKRWQSAKENPVTAPRMVLSPPHMLDKMLRDMRETADEVVTDAPALVAERGIPVKESPYPFALFQVEEKLRASLRRKIFLKSGAQIVVDPCEAMTVIDVNSAVSSFKRDKDSAALHINLEAAAEIARVLRLRGTGGIIVVDFIDMAADEDRLRVKMAMEEALFMDRVKTTVHGFTALGLLEMTRMRSDEKNEAERGVCPHCQGSGIIGLIKEETTHA